MHTRLRTAIVHDWLVANRGGEKVLDAILELFPGADVFTLFSDPGSLQGHVKGHPIRHSWLNALPWARKYYRGLMPLMASAIERFDLSNYDLVISSHHSVAKGVMAPPDSTHICYCHTPARWAWNLTRHYLRDSPLKEAMAQPMLSRFRQWDTMSSLRVDRFLANSNAVARRIQRYYNRESEVVAPFVDLTTFRPVFGDRSDYYLVVSALVPYKRVDLAIAACQKLKRKLVVIGTGPEERRLRRLSGPDVKWLGHVANDELRDYYGSARALLLPGEEDFGIVPLEAMACGTPVIAFGKGGVLDTVIHEKTGMFFNEENEGALVTAIQRFDTLEKRLNRNDCRLRAEFFSRAAFQKNFSNAVQRAIAGQGPRSRHHEDYFQRPS